MDSSEPMYFENGARWREWLERNHAIATETWLLHYKKGVARPGISYREALDEALAFGWIDTKLKSLDKESYKLRYVPRKPGSLWSKINRGRVEQLFKEGRMTPAGMAAVEAARKSGKWDGAYTFLKPFEMPEDLKKALLENEKAFKNFAAFANSYRNGYIHWVNSARTEVTRRKRIEDVVKCAAANIKPGLATPRQSAGRLPR